MPTVAQLGATALHILWCWLFVSRLEWGILGLGMAMILTNVGMLTMIEVYSLCIPRIQDSIFCLNVDAFKNWGEYFKFGVPATVMLCAEFWAFEILIFLSGTLGVNQ